MALRRRRSSEDKDEPPKEPWKPLRLSDAIKQRDEEARKNMRWDQWCIEKVNKASCCQRERERESDSESEFEEEEKEDCYRNCMAKLKKKSLCKKVTIALVCGGAMTGLLCSGYQYLNAQNGSSNARNLRSSEFSFAKRLEKFKRNVSSKKEWICSVDFTRYTCKCEQQMVKKEAICLDTLGTDKVFSCEVAEDKKSLSGCKEITEKSELENIFMTLDYSKDKAEAERGLLERVRATWTPPVGGWDRCNIKAQIMKCVCHRDPTDTEYQLCTFYTYSGSENRNIRCQVADTELSIYYSMECGPNILQFDKESSERKESVSRKKKQIADHIDEVKTIKTFLNLHETKFDHHCSLKSVKESKQCRCRYAYGKRSECQIDDAGDSYFCHSHKEEYLMDNCIGIESVAQLIGLLEKYAYENFWNDDISADGDLFIEAWERVDPESFYDKLADKSGKCQYFEDNEKGITEHTFLCDCQSTEKDGVKKCKRKSHDDTEFTGSMKIEDSSCIVHGIVDTYERSCECVERAKGATWCLALPSVGYGRKTLHQCVKSSDDEVKVCKTAEKGDDIDTEYICHNSLDKFEGSYCVKYKKTPKSCIIQ